MTLDKNSPQNSPPPCPRGPGHTVIGMGMKRPDYDYTQEPVWWCKDCLDRVLDNRRFK